MAPTRVRIATHPPLPAFKAWLPFQPNQTIGQFKSAVQAALGQAAVKVDLKLDGYGLLDGTKCEDIFDSNSDIVDVFLTALPVEDSEERSRKRLKLANGQAAPIPALQPPVAQPQPASSSSSSSSSSLSSSLSSSSSSSSSSDSETDDEPTPKASPTKPSPSTAPVPPIRPGTGTSRTHARNARKRKKRKFDKLEKGGAPSGVDEPIVVVVKPSVVTFGEKGKVDGKGVNVEVKEQAIAAVAPQATAGGAKMDIDPTPDSSSLGSLTPSDSDSDSDSESDAPPSVQPSHPQTTIFPQAPLPKASETTADPQMTMFSLQNRNKRKNFRPPPVRSLAPARIRFSDQPGPSAQPVQPRPARLSPAYTPQSPTLPRSRSRSLSLSPIPSTYLPFANHSPPPKSPPKYLSHPALPYEEPNLPPRRVGELKGEIPGNVVVTGVDVEDEEWVPGMVGWEGVKWGKGKGKGDAKGKGKTKEKGEPVVQQKGAKVVMGIAEDDRLLEYMSDESGDETCDKVTEGSIRREVDKGKKFRQTARRSNDKERKLTKAQIGIEEDDQYLDYMCDGSEGPYGWEDPMEDESEEDMDDEAMRDIEVAYAEFVGGGDSKGPGEEAGGESVEWTGIEDGGGKVGRGGLRKGM